MLEVLVSFTNCFLMTIAGYYIVKILTKSRLDFFNAKTISFLLLGTLIIAFLQENAYAEIKPLIVYCINIIIYKKIFDLHIDDAIIVVGIAMLLCLIGDLLVAIITTTIFSNNMEVINDTIIGFLINTIILGITLITINIPIIKKKLCEFANNIKHKKKISTVVFFSLTIIIFCILGFHISSALYFNISYIVTIIVIAILWTLIIIFINSRNKYDNLVKEYDSLFLYVQNFEDWIEKEQLNRHEYKNQLAVLRCLTKEKKIKDKIDEILKDNINIEGQAVTNLKNLPKGGIKGLMYYKAAIAQKQKINLITDVSLEKNGILTKLSEKDIRILCKLIGIYFDNAIEAAVESRKKNLTIEVYEFKNKVNIVFSNTFKKHKNMKDRNKKGVSSKGEGRGNGLYFAKKLIKENPWIEEKQEIIDNYYIQKITVNKKNRNYELNPKSWTVYK